MAYCRFDKTCKVYMYHSGGGYFFNLIGTNTHPQGCNFIVPTAVEALRRLKRLQTQGFGVPQYAIDRLQREVDGD
jgi:hypothetical protein